MKWNPNKDLRASSAVMSRGSRPGKRTAFNSSRQTSQRLYPKRAHDYRNRPAVGSGLRPVPTPAHHPSRISFQKQLSNLDRLRLYTNLFGVLLNLYQSKETGSLHGHGGLLCRPCGFPRQHVECNDVAVQQLSFPWHFFVGLIKSDSGYLGLAVGTNWSKRKTLDIGRGISSHHNNAIFCTQTLHYAYSTMTLGRLSIPENEAGVQKRCRPGHGAPFSLAWARQPILNTTRSHLGRFSNSVVSEPLTLTQYKSEMREQHIKYADPRQRNGESHRPFSVNGCASRGSSVNNSIFVIFPIEQVFFSLGIVVNNLYSVVRTAFFFYTC